MPALTFAQGDVSDAASRKLIERMEVEWNQAHLHGDVDALDRLWAPDLKIIVPGMAPFSKAELLNMWRNMRVSFTEYATSEVDIQLYGDVAVVTGRLHRSRDFAGRKATEDWQFTKTYAVTDGRWQVVSYHASETPPGHQ